MITSIVDVKAGQQVSIPIELTELPDGTCSFEVVIECDSALLDLIAVDPSGSMIEGKLFFFNNQSVVHNWQDQSISKEWKSPYSTGRVIVVCADGLPLAGELMFTLIGQGKVDSKVVVTATYLLLNTDLQFGRKPQMIHLIS